MVGSSGGHRRDNFSRNFLPSMRLLISSWNSSSVVRLPFLFLVLGGAAFVTFKSRGSFWRGRAASGLLLLSYEKLEGL